MQNKSLKPLDSMLFMALLLFPFFKPAAIGQIMPSLNTLFNLWSTVSTIIIFLMFLWRKKISAILIAVTAYFGVMTLSTLINSGNYRNVFASCIPTIAFCMLTEMAVKKNCKKYFSTVFRIYFVLILINFILTLLFPQGIAVDEYYKANTYNFLGIDNELAINVSIPLISIAVLYSAFRGKRLTNSALLVLIMISATTLITWSATGVVSWFIELSLVLYILFVRKRAFPKGMNIYVFYLIYAVLEILFVFIRAQVHLSFIIENILHKDINFMGRTSLWDQYLVLIPQSPIIGHGVFEGHGLAQLGNLSYGTHNVVVGLLVKGGIVGLVAYFIPFFIAARKLYQTQEHHLSSILSVSLFSILFIFIMEAQNEKIWVFGFLFIADNIESIIRQYEVVDHESILLPALSQESSAKRKTAKRKSGFRFVWKPPIWLDEDDGRATGIREENVSFGVFDTLIRRSVARPADLFHIMEQNDQSVPEHFAQKRMEAERAAFAKLGPRMGLADIYEELLPLYGNHTNDLMALEIQYEIAGCRPVADNIDLMNLCMEHDKNVFLMADTYLPSSVIRRMLDVCGVYHYDRLYVSCEEGACKADGSLFWKVLADQEIRPHELRHIGSDRQGDVTEPWRVGVHVKRGKKKDPSTTDKELPEDIALYERTLQSCIRNCADDLDSSDARLGCETFGPLLAGFAAWLRERLRMDGIQDVYFLAGDGSVLKQAFDTLEDGAFRTHSLYFPVQTAEQDHEALLAYIRACGMQGRVALVDTGRAAVQKTLEKLIAEAGLDIQVKGYYVGMADADGIQAAGYLYEPGKGTETLEKLSPIAAIFNTIFHAQHGAVRRIAMRDGQPVPELDAYEYASDKNRICDEIAILRAYQAGALALVHEMNRAFPGGAPQIPGEAAILPLLRMGTKPTKQEVELWGDFRVFRDGKAILMARPKGVGAYLLHPGRLKRDYAASPWKIGFLRRLSRLPLAYDKIAKRHARNG